MSSLPELLQKKRYIDMHTTIATALLDCIKARKLDLYFETEEKLMSRSALVSISYSYTHCVIVSCIQVIWDCILCDSKFV